MAELGQGKIIKVSGPVVLADEMTDAKMYDVVRVGNANLIGEIVELDSGRASIQVYEDTTGVGPGEPVKNTGAPLSVELGPGLVSSIYDGIQRPLDVLYELEGSFIERGNAIPGLSRDKKWEFKPLLEDGEEVTPGDIIGEVQESSLLLHKIMVPQGVSGTLKGLKSGSFTVKDTICQIEQAGGETADITLMQKCPVRTPRQPGKRLKPNRTMITGQRVIDTFFPLGLGGTACVPGPFGSGKTVVQHQLAKWIDADLVVYIGCGERGNEMTDVLTEFPELKDPKSGKPLMERVVLIANTSNMPVAAREASVYTGITIAEYFRDMGYKVAIMADSTSRWAEAMREISTRLEEMPAEEGYPAYLGARIASFYERAGRISCLGKPEREGCLSIIGAVSPPGGDLSDSVVQATLHVVKVFWSLQSKLAQQRHFPAIDWLTSYSFYKQYLKECFKNEDMAVKMDEMIAEAMALLEQEADLLEIVRLVGSEAISPNDQVALKTSKSIREDYLHQNAFHKVDTYTSIEKQYAMLEVILHMHKKALEAVKNGHDASKVFRLEVADDIARAKYIPEEQIESIEEIKQKIDQEIQNM